VVPSGDAALTRDVLRQAMKAGAERGHLGVIVQPWQAAPEVNDALSDLGFYEGAIPVAPEATIRIRINRPEDQILAAMSRSRRGNIRKSMRETIAVESSADVALFYRLYAKTAQRQAFSGVSLNYLEEQWKALVPHDAIRLLVAHGPTGPAAAIWLTRFGGTVTYRLGGWDSDASTKLHVNEALHWTAMKLAKAEGDHTYDLGGFDAKAAALILSGRSPPAGFFRTPSYFKLGFDPVPKLLPTPRMRLFSGPANRIARAFAPALLRTSFAGAVAQRLRSG
jgi:hypothetical protein